MFLCVIFAIFISKSGSCIFTYFYYVIFHWASASLLYYFSLLIWSCYFLISLLFVIFFSNRFSFWSGLAMVFVFILLLPLPYWYRHKVIWWVGYTKLLFPLHMLPSICFSHNVLYQILSVIFYLCIPGHLRWLKSGSNLIRIKPSPYQTFTITMIQSKSCAMGCKNPSLNVQFLYPCKLRFSGGIEKERWSVKD